MDSMSPVPSSSSSSTSTSTSREQPVPMIVSDLMRLLMQFVDHPEQGWILSDAIAGYINATGASSASIGQIGANNNSQAIESMPISEWGSLLAVAVQHPEVPTALIAQMLQLVPAAAAARPCTAGDECSYQTDEVGRRLTGNSPSLLHLVILSLAASTQNPRVDLVRLLLAAAPEAVRWRDAEALRPIDILAQRIVMKEERLKYRRSHHPDGNNNNSNNDTATTTTAPVWSRSSSRGRIAQGPNSTRRINNSNNNTTVGAFETQPTPAETNLMQLWQVVRLIAACHGRTYSLAEISTIGLYEDDSIAPCVSAKSITTATTSQRTTAPQTEDPPTLHVCLAAMIEDSRDVLPMSLLERAFDRYNYQLNQRDSRGNLPLHIVVSGATRTMTNNGNLNRTSGTDVDDSDSNCDEDTMDFMFSLLKKVLKMHPAAAAVTNHADQLALDLAVAASLTWHSGIEILLRAYPPGLDHAHVMPRACYPYLIHALFQKQHNAINSTDTRDLVFSFLRTHPDPFQ